MPRALSHNGLIALKVKALDYREVYAGLLWVAENSGFKNGWVAHKFKEIYGKWPRPTTVVEPQAPDNILREWLGIERARYRAKKKREEVRAANLASSLLSHDSSERP